MIRAPRAYLVRALAAGLLALIAPAAQTATPTWVGSWTASPQPVWGADFPFPLRVPARLDRQTVRQFARLSLGGRRIRLVFANDYGAAPLTLADVHVALGEVDRKVSFAGADSVTLPAGASLTSDPVDLSVAPLSRIAVSVYLPEATPLATFHWDARETATIAPGDQAGSPALTGGEATIGRLLLSEVLVEDPKAHGVVVALGDSITDGDGASIDADQRWPDVLGERLAPAHVAVLNAGISGARLLRDRMGVKAADRLDRDVLDQPGVRTLIVMIGINDIAWPGTEFAPAEAPIRAEELIEGYKALVARARAHGVRVIGATLTPFQGALPDAPIHGYYSPAKDALRQTINAWIRSPGAFDAVIDFDALVRDPAHPSRMRAELDSGDHLHPGDAGDRAMAAAIDLDALLPR